MEATAGQVTGGTVCYLYGLVLPPVQISDLAAVEEGAEVLLVQADGIACAMSPVSSSAYQEVPGSHDRDAQLAWLTPRALRHNEVLRRLHAATAVVPLKFGTVCPSIERVEALLRRLHEPIVRMLDRFSGKDEWTLKVSVDRDAVTTLLRARDCELAHAFQQTRDLTDGRAFFARKRLERLADERVAASIETIEDATTQRIEDLGIEMHRIERAGAFTAALLVPRDRFCELEAVLAALEAAHAGAGLASELSGPWPPYTFATTLETESVPDDRE